MTDLTYNRPSNVLASSPPITPLSFLKVTINSYHVSVHVVIINYCTYLPLSIGLSSDHS